MYNVMRKTKSKKYNNVIAMIIIIHDNSIRYRYNKIHDSGYTTQCTHQSQYVGATNVSTLDYRLSSILKISEKMQGK